MKNRIVISAALFSTLIVVYGIVALRIKRIVDAVAFAERGAIMFPLCFAFALSTLFFLLIIFMLPRAKKREMIKQDNQLLMVANETSESFIYEYDRVSKHLTFTGSTEFLFGKELKSLSYSQFDSITKIVHRTERKLLSEFSEFINSSKDSLSKEVRLRRSDDTYAWFKITAARSEDNRLIVGNVTNVNEQVVREQELKEKAETDTLSGLLNKGALEQHVKESIKKHKDSLLGAFYIIDLDNFKQVNDRIGHAMGDTAICDTAAKLKLIFSERDFIARIGGDEYCVFMQLHADMPPNYAIALITEKARSLGAILEEDYVGEQASVHVTASIGVSLLPQQGQNYKELFKKADTALYYVKRHGKNDFAIYENHMDSNEVLSQI